MSKSQNIINNSNKKIEFLYNSITDAREIIKIVDTKSNILVALIITSFIFLIKLKISIYFKMLIIIIGITTLLFLFYKVIFARFNPIKKLNNITLNKEYLYLFFPVNTKDFNKYTQNILNISEEDIIKVLALERLKLQIIIEEKIKNFNFAVKYLFCIFIIIFILAIIINFL